MAMSVAARGQRVGYAVASRWPLDGGVVMATQWHWDGDQ